MPRKKQPLTYEQRQTQLWLLFDALLIRFTSLLKDSPEVELKATYYSIIRDFLKDNEIVCKNVGRRSLSQGLTKVQADMKLPFDS